MKKLFLQSIVFLLVAVAINTSLLGMEDDNIFTDVAFRDSCGILYKVEKVDRTGKITMGKYFEEIGKKATLGILVKLEQNNNEKFVLIKHLKCLSTGKKIKVCINKPVPVKDSSEDFRCSKGNLYVVKKSKTDEVNMTRHPIQRRPEDNTVMVGICREPGQNENEKSVFIKHLHGLRTGKLMEVQIKCVEGEVSGTLEKGKEKKCYFLSKKNDGTLVLIPKDPTEKNKSEYSVEICNEKDFSLEEVYKFKNIEYCFDFCLKIIEKIKNVPKTSRKK